MICEQMQTSSCNPHAIQWGKQGQFLSIKSEAKSSSIPSRGMIDSVDDSGRSKRRRPRGPGRLFQNVSRGKWDLEKDLGKT